MERIPLFQWKEIMMIILIMIIIIIIMNIIERPLNVPLFQWK
jgi:ABC-type phosphate/phosphonate transport system permease subunit